MSVPRPLVRTAIVARVAEDVCSVFADGGLVPVTFAPPFPGPRTERVSPGHFVAIASGPNGRDVVVWRWFDAVVLGPDVAGLRLWEPAHGEFTASVRDPSVRYEPGSRAYASAGLPGADWWVAAPVGSDQPVDVDEVVRLYDQHGLWDEAFRA